MNFKIISIATKYKGRTVDVVHQKVELDDKKLIEFEYVRRKEVALIIPIVSENELLILEQYRASVNSIVLEFPAGKKNIDETIEETAVRELQEETGFYCERIKLIGSFYTAPHFTDEKVYVFVAENLVELKKNLEDKEIINCRIITLHDLQKLCEDDKINDAKSLVALQLFMTKFKKDV